MAKIPVYNDLQVAPGNVQQVEYGRQGNLFAGLGQGLQQAGQGLEQVAEDQKRKEESLARSKQAAEDEMDDVLALDASNRYHATVKDITQKHSQTVGKDAVLTAKDAQQEILKASERISSELANRPKAQQKFLLHSAPKTSDAVLGIDQHSFVEGNKFQEATYTAAVGNANIDATKQIDTNNPNTKKKRDQFISDAADGITKRMKGMPQLDIDLEIQKNLSKNITKQTIDNLIDSKNTDAADAYFNRHKDELLPNDLADVEKRFLSIKSTSAVYSQAQKDVADLTEKYKDQISVGNFTGIQAELLGKAAGQKTDDDNKLYSSYTKGIIEQAKGLYADGKIVAYEQAKARALNEGLTPALLSSHAWAAIGADNQQNLREMVAGAKYVVTDPKVFAELNAMTSSKGTTEEDRKLQYTKIVENAGRLDDTARKILFANIEQRNKEAEGGTTAFGAGWDEVEATLSNAGVDMDPKTNGNTVALLKNAFYTQYPKFKEANTSEKSNMISTFVSQMIDEKGKQKTTSLYSTNIGGVTDVENAKISLMESGKIPTDANLISKQIAVADKEDFSHWMSQVSSDYASGRRLAHEMRINTLFNADDRKAAALMWENNKKLNPEGRSARPEDITKLLYQKAIIDFDTKSAKPVKAPPPWYSPTAGFLDNK